MDINTMDLQQSSMNGLDKILPVLPQISMNRAAISLNNEAVEKLQNGDYVRAFHQLQQASNIVVRGVADHAHANSSNAIFRFHWMENEGELSSQDSEAGAAHPRCGLTWEGCASFLFLRTLRISIENEREVDNVCPCGFAWAVWYNLAICCSILGTRLGDRGQTLMNTAFHLYTKVQRRIDSEPPSRHWDVLRMAVMNNQACLYREFAMQDASVKCLKRLASTLMATNTADGEEDSDRKVFFLTLQILGNENLAPAA